MHPLWVGALLACHPPEVPPEHVDPPAADLLTMRHRLSADELRATAAQVLGVDVPTDAWFPAVASWRGFEQLDGVQVDLASWVDALAGWSRAVVDARRAVTSPPPPSLTLRGPDLAWDAGVLAVIPPWSFTVAQVTTRTATAPLEVPVAGTWTVLFAWIRASQGDAGAVLTLDGVELGRFEGPLEGTERRNDSVTLDLTAGPHVLALTPSFPREDPLAALQAPAWLSDPGPWVAVDKLVLTLQAEAVPTPGFVDCGPGAAPSCARDSLARLVAGLWRRPIEPAELDPLVAVLDDALAQGASLDEGLDDALVAAMLSPDFAYLVERPEAPAWALASRLSYALWQQGPDDALRACAASGELLLADGACGAQAQVGRMLADARSDVLVTGFAERWLGVADIERLGFVTHQQPRWSVPLATDLLVELDNRLRRARADHQDLRSIFTSTDSVGTGRVEQLYGLPMGSLSTPHAFDLGPSGRVGLLGMGAVELAWAKGTEPSIIDPAVWLLPRLLCRQPPSPPPDVPMLIPDQDPLAQMDAHLADPACAACHATIDPFGGPLTGFDAIGAARARPAGSYTLPDGALINDLGAYGAWLAASPEVASCITQHVASWAWRRRVNLDDPGDVAALAAVQQAAEADGFSFDALFAAALREQP